MATQSKEVAANMKEILVELLMGSRKKQLVSSTILLIIMFLIYVRNKNGQTPEIKFKLSDRAKKKVTMA